MRRTSPALAALILLVVAVTTSEAAGQSTIVMPPPPEALVSVERKADNLSRAGRYEESLAMLEEYLVGSPSSFIAQVRAAREALLLGIVASYADTEETRAWLGRSIAHGERAVALEPSNVEGRYFLLAAQGRLALIAGGPEKARLAVVVDSAARSLLADDSLHAGAHNALGRLYVEIGTLSWFERMFAKRWLGSELMSRATWHAAEAHLRRAIELQPERNLYYVDLGILLLARNRVDEARAVLESGIEVPLETPAAEVFRDHARRILDEMRQRGKASDG